MHVPPLLAFFIVFSIVAATAMTFRYWILEPEKVQAAAARLVASIIRYARFAYLIVRWPVSLAISWIVVLGATCVYVPLCLAWVLLCKVAGEPAKITIKLS